MLWKIKLDLENDSDNLLKNIWYNTEVSLRFVMEKISLI